MKFKKGLVIYFLVLAILGLIGFLFPKWYFSVYESTTLTDLQITMWQTTVTTILGVCGILGGLIYYTLSKVDSIKTTIDTSISPFKEFADLIKQIGMQELAKRISQLFEKLLRERPSEKINDPLPPEKIKRRDYLLDKGKKVGLTKDEANELKEILEEEAREAFISGLIGALAFAVLLLFIGLLVASLSEK
jgi:hypothetical protein